MSRVEFKFYKFLLATGSIISIWFIFYIFLLPQIITSNWSINQIQNIIKKTSGFDLIIEKPIFETKITPDFEIDIAKLYLKKDNKQLIKLEDFELEIDFGKILKKELKIDELSAKTLYVDVSQILKELPQNTQQETSIQKNPWTINFWGGDLNLKKAFINYDYNPQTNIEIYFENTGIEQLKDKKLLHINNLTKIKQQGKLPLNITINDENKIKIENKSIIIDNLDININNSNVKISTLMNAQNIDIKAQSENFYVADIFNIVNSNLIIPNGNELLAPLATPAGAVNFNINLLNQNLNGKINLKNASAKLKDLSNLELKMEKGTINITPEKLDFIGLNGYWGKTPTNTIKINGEIKDYYKTIDTNITIDTIATNEFFTDYLAPLIGNTAIKISHDIPTQVLYKSLNNKMDITWLTKIAKGVSFGIDDTPSPLNSYDRAIKGEFSLQNNELDIKNINYYIAENLYAGMAKIAPIMVFSGKTNIQSGQVHELGFSFGQELPSEFLNAISRQKLFKGGTIKGDLNVKFTNNIPKLDANMEINKTRIPLQRLRINNASIKTDSKNINLIANGRFKRVKYDFSGIIKNELLTPIIVKDLDLNLDNVDIERLLASLNNEQSQNIEPIITNEKDDTEEEIDDNYMFNTNLIVIEDCLFKLKQGKYKDLHFGNIEAQMTLDKNGIFNLQSNKFDIAEGISTLKINSNLKELTHYIRLGVKDVNSDLMSTTILNLSKEISGKASGLIELSTDKSMKLNGIIKFAVKDGTIGKVGLVEYLMKVASVFRNPIVMISPSTFSDIVNIPEGHFDKIEGDLKIKNNIIQKMNIKSYSPTLSALIKGRYDLENKDASLRIYTRFSDKRKGFFGFLRNFSLNSIANKVNLGGRNDANYYASELIELPQIEADEKDTQVFLTQIEGDIERFNFLSSLKKIK